ncbi:hypothetical protein J6590_071204 [Homalodisca vitripennis]|nr:hypothetical protein J6590_071204 [Homalodisca vitripennis]
MKRAKFIETSILLQVPVFVKITHGRCGSDVTSVLDPLSLLARNGWLDTAWSGVRFLRKKLRSRHDATSSPQVTRSPQKPDTLDLGRS